MCALILFCLLQHFLFLLGKDINLQDSLISLSFRNITKSLINKDQGELHKCPLCNYTTHGKQQFDIHCARHLRQHKFSCDYCSKGFVTKNEAIVHMRVHTGEKPFSCKICQKSFRHKHTLNVHLRTHSCKYCAKCYDDKNDLRLHESNCVGKVN